MELTFRLGVKDYLYFYVDSLKQRPLKIFGLILLVLAWPTITLWGMYFGGDLPVSVILKVEVVGLALSGCVTLAWISFLVTSAAKGRPGGLGVITIAITPDMLIERNPVLETKMRWSQIDKISESARFLVFSQSPGVCWIVPKSAFPSAARAREFLETARAFQRGTPLEPSSTETAWPPPPQRDRIVS